MKVTLLGTGAADGWPNAFCRCDSCSDARRRHDFRAQTAALVDNALMLDFGSDAPGSAVRHGASLADVRHVLITHAHADHLAPQSLLFRSWVDGVGELELIGPADALDVCRPWVGPDAGVRFTPVVAGDQVRVGDHDVRVLPARHQVFRDGDAVLYDVTGPDGMRLLWATDTGVWPDDWFDAVTGAEFDAVFLEETFGDREDLSDGHLGLPGFATMVAALRGVGAVVDSTDVVAVHLGHHNPPVGVLRERLRDLGARPGRDGEVLDLGESVGRRIFVTGGARSGKSRYAEGLLAGVDDVVYVAAGGPRAGDPDWDRRVELHRERRPASWTTIEDTEVAGVLRSARHPVLVDCLGTWLAARIDHHDAWESGELDAVRSDVEDLLDAWRSCPVPVVAVSNEVGSGVVPATASGRLFRDELGRLNAEMADRADQVVMMVAGQPLVVR
ncbi:MULTISPECIES: bifunctional adenosylcobinamide kinase/adenosylcobinamide-phosphate guanylyltransferase [Gordonia]|jgi:adenosylcobinamide kinase/adenosylcobinamide-phosphate guanylyltransferase|uniref:bifunctional adenosylcobinamide kinase/adenosylcobinamide-phosphate guanylyltransferase n=1 Tax=Gordonia TaxID=2053 RepID=UPI0012BB1E05|nr:MULTISPECIES: bifunctional adenosylcobinamide kinase/adenosylcobinamide-phosphate guanylyltransferase [Gordonia]MDH3010984.1 bifunctional adenosylcobinamide kinase/adenosylcobinamide-phosphate guanylyltransferase [Gordonia alkanivorans]MDH3017616.1 bifunctional adenosylcobinamide kinase/adenosylcobinamide-phosphate guanylyltransferase [Gordonia alkanivorans]MDH3026288.1 bifunctional adenosylcobinamide kinase/adenosylcobinamide-phosphate guanylyltransferase [Gordonia alkanivorans]MDH3042901.1